MKSSANSARTLYLMHALTHITRARLDEALRDLELSALQYTMLSVIEHNAGLSSARLSRRFQVTQQSMGEMVALLEKKGMISRIEDSNNRKVLLLSLTEAGYATTKAGDAIAEKLESAVFETLDSDEVTQLRETLSKVLAHVRTD